MRNSAKHEVHIRVDTALNLPPTLVAAAQKQRASQPRHRRHDELDVSIDALNSAQCISRSYDRRLIACSSWGRSRRCSIASRSWVRAVFSS
jgi:hypothetical protein